MNGLKHETDVLIAGAGPTGLALAIELKRRGKDFVIIDSNPEAAQTSRAVVIHARTLEVLEPSGVTPDLVKQGVRVPIFRIRDRDRELITVDFADIPSAYPYTLMLSQDRTEGSLLYNLRLRGGAVIRPCAFVRGRAMDSGVEAEVRSESGIESIRARWLVGCDGMHSKVREQGGIEFEGAQYEQGFILADVHMDWPISREEVTLFYSPEGLVVIAPLPDEQVPNTHFRLVATMEAAPESPTLDDIQSVLDARGPSGAPGRIRDLVWSSRFHIHHRVAASSRKGPILLCGDAAHVHSPAGGQGMNTGIQDAVSLAPVLADTLGDSNSARLDDWAGERHQVAKDVVALTDRITRVATMKSATGRALRDAAVMFAGHLPPVRAAIARKLAEVDR